MNKMGNINKPLVSIIMPLYNSERFVQESLDSCINQTYRNIEVIVVNDGSTDRSLEIVKDYALIHPQVKVYTQNNSGACRARNLAFQLSKGDYIMYLDSDDILDETKIEKQLNLIKSHDKYTVALGAWQEFTDNINVEFESRPYYHDYLNPIDMLVEIWSTGGYFQTSCYLCSREIIEKTGQWNENLSRNQDGEFFCRVLNNASKLYFCNDAKLYYRRGHESISTSQINSDKKVESVLESYKTYKNILLNRQDTRKAREALGRCYALVMCGVSPYSDYYHRAANEIKLLGVKAKHPKPSFLVNILCVIIGFPKAIKHTRTYF